MSSLFVSLLFLNLTAAVDANTPQPEFISKETHCKQVLKYVATTMPFRDLPLYRIRFETPESVNIRPATTIDREIHSWVAFVQFLDLFSGHWFYKHDDRALAAYVRPQSERHQAYTETLIKDMRSQGFSVEEVQSLEKPEDPNSQLQLLPKTRALKPSSLSDVYHYLRSLGYKHFAFHASYQYRHISNFEGMNGQLYVNFLPNRGQDQINMQIIDMSFVDTSGLLKRFGIRPLNLMPPLASLDEPVRILDIRSRPGSIRVDFSLVENLEED